MQVGIDEEAPLPLEVLAERLGEGPVAVADDDDLDALRAPGPHPVAQLRDLLTAEESAEVSEEDQDGRPVPPEIAQPDGLVGRGVDERDGREARGSAHGTSSGHESRV